MKWLTAPSPSTVVNAVLEVSGEAGLGLLLALAGLVVLIRCLQRFGRISRCGSA